MTELVIPFQLPKRNAPEEPHEPRPPTPPVCELLGIEHPVVQAGTGYVVRAELVAAFSEAGGLGVVGGAGFPPERLEREIQRVWELTGRPFGVDLILPAQTTSGDVLAPRPPSQRPSIDPADLDKDVNLGEFAANRDGTPGRSEELMQIVVEEEVPVFASGLGNRGPWVRQLHERGTVVMAPRRQRQERPPRRRRRCRRRRGSGHRRGRAHQPGSDGR